MIIWQHIPEEHKDAAATEHRSDRSLLATLNKAVSLHRSNCIINTLILEIHHF